VAVTTMIDPLQRALAVGRLRAAVTCAGVTFTYDEMWSRARRLIGGLRSLGLERGDRVAIVSSNCHRYIEIYQAVPGAGLVLVPLNQRHTVAELRYALDDSGTKMLFVNGDPLPFTDLVEHVVDLGDGYERLLETSEPADFPADVSEDDLAGLFYTGGTTGAAKGVMLSHRNLIANAFHFQTCYAFDANTRWLVVAPLFHAAGSIAVLMTVWHAGRHVMLGAFEPGAALDLVASERVTATLVVPTMLAAISEEQLARPRDVSSLQLISHGGAPVATETLRRAHQAFPSTQLLHLYGATETSPIATALPDEELLLDTPLARSCGQPVVGVEIAVLDGSGVALPRGSVGEVAIRGANVMLGYWNKPDETARALVDGWYRSGDLGYLDDEAHLFLVDRSKDMVVTGGENVYSTEVEDVLYRHPAVLEAAVFGIPDARWGEAVHAVVVPRQPAASVPGLEQELIAFCRQSIAGYKVPKRIDVRDEPLPKSGAGKILKRELRAPFWSDRDTLVSGT
jgi:long-chain acyl-CoA synthetase